MAKSSISVPSRTYQPGTRSVTLPNLTTDDHGINASFTRESWPVGDGVLSGSVDGSNDGGASWFNLTVFSFDGGDMVNPRSGLPVTSSGITIYWPESYDANGVATPHRPQQVRATVANTVALTTAITIQGV